MIEENSVDFFKNSNQFLQNVAVDNVIFGYHEKELRVLLQQPYILDKWTVTGGYIKRIESLEEAASRIAFSRTGLNDLFFRQFHSFGHPKRVIDDGFTAEHLKMVTGIDVPADSWIFDYFVSVSFYTLTEFSKVEMKKGEMEAACQWWPVSDLPPMMFDHKLIISEALIALRLHIAHFPIGLELLPEKFTLPEIHNLYETILGKSLDDRNFSKRLMATGIIIKLNETKKIGAHRSPYLYKFDKEKYEEGLKSGVTLVF
jgi:ADP-ribose pyrophosphatase YjhB (NUDIX family)